MLIRFLGFTVLISIILALWEIQIEGKNGWASKLPCWRIKKGSIMKIMGGRPVTGYHFYMILFLAAIIHFPLLFSPWSWRAECLVVGFLLAMVTLEDFLWFVFNPAYGIKSFRKGMIPWRKHWIGPIPDFYIYCGTGAALLIWLGHQVLV